MECPICLEEITKYQSFIFSECLHKYHINCYNYWINYQKNDRYSCPECNTINKGIIKYTLPEIKHTLPEIKKTNKKKYYNTPVIISKLPSLYKNKNTCVNCIIS